ncbi:MAG: TadE/TadG family type IV pilus assembly protein [Asticcacaulis sp.]
MSNDLNRLQTKGVRRLGLDALLRGFRNESGAGAVEFALVVAPFLFLLFGVMELALIVLAGITLEGATDRFSRLVRTGQFPTATATPEKIKAEICKGMTFFSTDCVNSLVVDVRVLSDYSNIPTADPISNGNFDNSQIQSKIGNGGEIQMVRAYMQWTLLFPMMKPVFHTLDSGKSVLSAKTTFKNEQF